MKNKVIFRIIALALVAVMCLGVVACDKKKKDDKGTTDTSATTVADNTAAATEAGTTAGTTDSTDNGGNVEVKPVGDEALFAEILKAYDASSKYSGAMTIYTEQTEIQKEGDGDYSVTAAGTASYNPADGSVIANTTMSGSYGGQKQEQTIQTKQFMLDDGYYAYEKSTASSPEGEPQVREEFTKMAGPDVIEGADEILELTNEMIGGIYKAESYAALKAAFAKVLPELKDKTVAELKEDGEFKDDTVFTLDHDVSIKQENGEIVLTIVIDAFISEIEDGDVQNVKSVITRSIACKNGMISSIYVDMNMTGDINNGESVSKAEMSSAMSFDLSYSFDKAAYDALVVTLPEDKSQIIDESKKEDGNILVYIGSAETERWLDKETSAAQFFADYEEYVKNRFGWEYVTDGMVETRTPNVKINGFYKDAALTQAIDPAAITRDELLALDAIYTDYTIRENAALVSENYESEYVYSLDYQIVMWNMFNYKEAGMKDPSLVITAEPFRFDVGEGTKVIVNGVEVQGNSINLESGKVYIIDYVRTYGDAEADLGDIGVDML